ncbi:MAG: hypothetical protein GXO75_07845 [Calditrichaeota bacterium]|nr:hypothetical protein [Calditrichota bacterium]
MKHFMLFLFLVLFSISISETCSAQKLDLVFSHKYHVEEVGAECTDCHAAADSSMQPKDNLLPDMETCYSCHDEDTKCTVCHKDPDNAGVYPRITSYISHFPHAKHIENEIECLNCHANVEKSENIYEKHLPPMTKCQSCHGDIQEPDYCSTCHAKGKDLKPEDHRLDWLKAHGISQELNTENCTKCHTQNQCNDCHRSDNLDHKVHPLNFVNNHSLVAKGNIENCYTCHEEQLFCIDCHRQELVMPRSHASAGWSNTKTGGRHARAAKFDLDSCASCHNEPGSEPICSQCHQEK